MEKPIYVRFLSEHVLVALTCGMLIATAQAEPRGKQAVPDKGDEKAVLTADKDLAGTFVREHRNDLVFVKNKEGAGSGFVVSMRGRKVLISNAHVMAALKGATFQLLDRSTLRVGTASVAVGHDLTAFVVTEGGTGIPMSTAVEAEAQIGDEVVVLGDTSGGGVVTTLHGKILGIGPDRIEVSAPFEHGNSGSPIVHLQSGKVIGVATYAELDLLLSGKEKIRRFGYRLDTAKIWQQVDWGRFYLESAAAERILTATRELVEILDDFQDVRSHNVSRAYETPALRSALDTYYSDVMQGAVQAPAATRNLLAALRDACKADLNAVKGQFTYDYFNRQLQEHELIRARFIKALEKALQA